MRRIGVDFQFRYTLSTERPGNLAQSCIEDGWPVVACGAATIKLRITGGLNLYIEFIEFIEFV